MNWDLLPAPPVIQDPALLEEARSHKTWTVKGCESAGSTRESLQQAEVTSYKRLELLGDSVISLFVLNVLLEEYPHFTTSAVAVSAT